MSYGSTRIGWRNAQENPQPSARHLSRSTLNCRLLTSLWSMITIFDGGRDGQNKRKPETSRNRRPAAAACDCLFLGREKVHHRRDEYYILQFYPYSETVSRKREPTGQSATTHARRRPKNPSVTLKIKYYQVPGTRHTASEKTDHHRKREKGAHAGYNFCTFVYMCIVLTRYK